MSVIPDVRPSPIAGLWYQDDPVQLALQIENYLSAASVPVITQKVVGLIAPHAGHRYSGRTAGHAYRVVSGRSYEIVAIVSPLHSYYPSPVLTSAHRHYGTPLGEVPIDRNAVQQLSTILLEQGVNLTPIANDDEHSLEIQLPFLQRALKDDFKLLPLMVRRRDARFTQILGESLARVLNGRKALLVASTDLSHFYPLQVAKALDREMLRQIENFSPEGVLKAEESETGFACGAGAVMTVLHAARAMGANEVRVLHYSTSADETGDTSSVVGY